MSQSLVNKFSFEQFRRERSALVISQPCEASRKNYERKTSKNLPKSRPKDTSYSLKHVNHMKLS